MPESLRARIREARKVRIVQTLEAIDEGRGLVAKEGLPGYGDRTGERDLKDLLHEGKIRKIHNETLGRMDGTSGIYYTIRGVDPDLAFAAQTKDAFGLSLRDFFELYHGMKRARETALEATESGPVQPPADRLP